MEEEGEMEVLPAEVEVVTGEFEAADEGFLVAGGEEDSPVEVVVEAFRVEVVVEAFRVEFVDVAGVMGEWRTGTDILIKGKIGNVTAVASKTILTGWNATGAKL